MKADLSYDDKGYEIHLEPTDEWEKCALEYLSGRPNDQIRITITRLGVFENKEG